LRALGVAEDAVTAWARQTIEEGCDACEALIAAQDGPFCFGETVSLADICLVPQMFNAQRFGVAMRWPRIKAITAHCEQLEAFAKAAPESQPDAA
jgi:maleylpyruvate isomerase